MSDGKAIFAVFHSEREVRTTLAALARADINRSRVSVFRPEQLNAQGFRYEANTEVKEGALLGAMIGAVTGVAIGVFFDTLPSLTTMGRSPLEMTLLLTTFGLILGGGIGALIGFGAPEHLGRRYARYLSEGEILVSVHPQDEEGKFQTLKILNASGGFEIEPQKEQEILPTIARHWYRVKRHAPAS